MLLDLIPPKSSRNGSVLCWGQEPHHKAAHNLSLIHTSLSLSTEPWHLTYEPVMEDMHSPELATMQAALLYMQRPLNGSLRALSDSPRTWSFWSSVVGMASSLGLHLECRLWGIPPWEKRLRRRLWWAVCMEDTWRSLRSGRPRVIQSDEWDVAELDEDDFDNVDHEVFPTSASAQYPAAKPIFSDLIRLTLLVADVQKAFY